MIENNKCALCRKYCDKDSMNAVPMFFAPAARFLYACALPGLNPIASLIEAKGLAPVCPACRRASILSCVAIYLLVIGGIVAMIFGD